MTVHVVMLRCVEKARFFILTDDDLAKKALGESYPEFIVKNVLGKELPYIPFLRVTGREVTLQQLLDFAQEAVVEFDQVEEDVLY